MESVAVEGEGVVVVLVEVEALHNSLIIHVQHLIRFTE